MPLGDFTVTFDGDILGAGTEKSATYQIQVLGQDFIKDADDNKVYFSHRSAKSPVPLSLPFTETLKTDVVTGTSTVIAYRIRVATAFGSGGAVDFNAPAAGSALNFSDLVSNYAGPPVPEDIAVRAEDAAADAQAAAAAAAAVGSTNDAIMATVAGTPTSAFSGALATTVAESITNAAQPSRLTAATLAGQVGIKLTIPTHLSPGGGETTHPSVLEFPGGFGGYKYWMAHTPYPAADISAEDPNIVASNDGVTWVVPAGLTNPIDDAPGGASYNSDTELVQAPDGRLWLLWRRVETGLGVERIRLSKSSDGVTWTSAVTILETSLSPQPHALSPTLVFEDGAWTLWVVDMSTSPNVLTRRRSGGPDVTAPADWTSATTCTITGAISGKEPWHVQVRKVGSQYVGLLTVCDTATSGDGAQIQAIVSNDGGAWTGGTTSVIPTLKNTVTGGHNRLYRASFIPTYVEGELTLRTWYSAVLSPPSGSTQWNIYLTTIRPPAAGGVETVPAGEPVPAGTPSRRILVRSATAGATVARNWVTNSSPTTKIDYWGAGFSGTGGVATYTRETSGGPGPGKGANSWAKKVWTTAPSTTSSYHTFGSNTVSNITVTGSAVWTLSAWLYVSFAASVTSVRVLFYDASNATLNGGAEVLGMYYPHAAGTWERRHLTVITPAGAVRAAIRGYHQNVIPGVGAVTGMSSLYASPGEALYDYHDGAQSPDPKLTASWVGVAYDTNSVLTAPGTYLQAWDGTTATPLS